MSRDAAVLVVLVLALVSIGLVMLYSATGVEAATPERSRDAHHFLVKQLVWVLLSFAAMAGAAFVPSGTWARWRLPILAASVALLGLVFVPGVGVELNAARRWVRAGGWFFQPSEAAKLGIAVFLCGFVAADPERLKRFFAGFAPACGAIAVVSGLILVEPDVGTALFVAMVMGLTLLVAGLRMTHAVPVFVSALGFLAYYAVTHTEHVRARLEAWLHPELDPQGKGHQITQSLVALGSGGWTGSGLGRGLAKLSFLPEVHSDFIFPVIGEELGFAGAAAVLLLYAALGVVGYRIMFRASGRFGFLLSFALTSYIILQAAMNVAVVTAAIPTKGIPLPFISAGGSCLVFTMAGMGMLVRIANESERGACREGVSGSSSPEAAPADTSFRA